MNTKEKKYVVTFVMALFASVISVSAQATDEIVRTKYIFDKKIPSFIDIEQKDNSDVKEKVDGKSYLEQLLQLNKETTAVLVDTYTDSIGGFHEVYKEYYKGIEVDGSKYALHYNKDGQIYRASGCFWTIESLNTTARLSENEALQSSTKEIGAEKYVWEDAHSEQSIKYVYKDDKAKYYPTGKLFVHIKEGVPYLTYQFIINAVKPELHYNVFVDANNGKIVDKYSTASDVTATANTNYSGNYKTIQTSYENEDYNAYVLHDTTRGNGITTRKWNFQHYTSDDNTWSQLNDYDRNAIDVHWGLEKIYDFYLNKFNRNSLDGNGASITSEVNVRFFKNCTINYIDNNAFIVCGFKDSIVSRPYVSLDVLAHEFAHGVTNYTSELVDSAESGAINEGMSDIMSVCAEQWAKSGKSDADIWKLGEDVYELRNLANPDCKYYNGSNWGSPSADYDKGWIHNNSGVFSYWAYLLTHGGTNSDSNISVPISVTAIELEKVMNICYRTNVNKLSSYSNYESLAEYTSEAAVELNFSASDVNQVRNAWYNVGVMSLSDIMPIEGPTQIYTSATYYVNNLPSGWTVAWSLSDSYYNNSNYLQQNSPSANQCTITLNPSRAMNSTTLTATISYAGVVRTTVTKIIHSGFLGTYTNNGQTKLINLPNPLFVRPSSSLIVSSERLKGASVTYSGNTPTSWFFNSSGGVLTIGLPSTNPFNIYVQCSNGDVYNIPVVLVPTQSIMSIDVSDGIINISVDRQLEIGTNSTDNSHVLLWSIEIYNAVTGQKVYAQEVIGAICNVDTSGWKEGIYVVRAKIGEEVTSEKITIQ